MVHTLPLTPQPPEAAALSRARLRQPESCDGEPTRILPATCVSLTRKDFSIPSVPCPIPNLILESVTSLPMLPAPYGIVFLEQPAFGPPLHVPAKGRSVAATHCIKPASYAAESHSPKIPFCSQQTCRHLGQTNCLLCFCRSLTRDNRCSSATHLWTAPSRPLSVTAGCGAERFRVCFLWPSPGFRRNILQNSQALFCFTSLCQQLWPFTPPLGLCQFLCPCPDIFVWHWHIPNKQRVPAQSRET